MTSSRGSQPRSEVAPPRESAVRGQRSGYLALAVSGLVLATAFGAVAQLAGPDNPRTDSRTTAQTGRSNTTGGGPDLVPGEAVPSETTIMVDGVAVTGALPTSTGSPTTVVSTGADGRQTTTVISPSKKPTPSSSSSSRHTTTSRPGSSSQIPGTTITTTTTTTNNPPPTTDEPSDPPPDPDAETLE